MPLRHWFFLLILVMGAVLFTAGMRQYAVALSGHSADPAGTMAAGRAAMRALPMAAVGVLLVTAAAMGWWRSE